MDTHLSAAAAPGNDEDESGEDEVDALMWSQLLVPALSHSFTTLSVLFVVNLRQFLLYLLSLAQFEVFPYIVS